MVASIPGFNHLPFYESADIQVFDVNSTSAGNAFQIWTKPPGKTMSYMIVIGGGGGGGTGVVGAVSTAAGGGGGGSGAQSTLLIPTMFLPDKLFISIGIGGAASTAGIASYIGISPDITANDLLLQANGGGLGGNGSGATGGTAGSGGTAVTIANCPLAGMGHYNFIAGQAGTAGGTTGAGTSLVLPLTGLIITGGTGGGGLPASGNGSAGGLITSVGQLPGLVGGVGSSGSGTAGGVGQNGVNAALTTGTATGAYVLIRSMIQPSGNTNNISGGILYFFGGTGGGSGFTSGTANGGIGGNGNYGCGAGGGGGTLTGGTAGTGGIGGPGLGIIISW